MISFDAENSANWLKVWEKTLTAQDVPHPYLNQFFSIPEEFIPLQIESELIAVQVEETIKEKNNLVVAWCNPHISTGVSNEMGGVPDTVLKGQRILDNKVSLCRFPLTYSSSYSISINPYWWVRQIKLKVWVYTGEKQDSYENKLDEILDLIRS